MKKFYRLYLGGKRGSETIPPAEIEAFLEQIVDRVLPGYFRYEGDGIWHGRAERAVVLEYVGTQSEEAVISDIARLYALHFGQDSVLVLQQSVQAEFIASPTPFPEVQPPFGHAPVFDEPESGGAPTI